MADSLNLTSLVEFLLSEEVSFVLVGGLAAVAQGAPLTTQDVDIVHARTPENLDRLMVALGKLDARHRGRAPDSPLPPDRRALMTTGHSLLMTRLGRSIAWAPSKGDEITTRSFLSVEIELEGHRLRVLGLETVVAIKRESTELKDRLALPVLEATLKRR